MQSKNFVVVTVGEYPEFFSSEAEARAFIERDWCPNEEDVSDGVFIAEVIVDVEIQPSYKFSSHIAS